VGPVALKRVGFDRDVDKLQGRSKKSQLAKKGIERSRLRASLGRGGRESNSEFRARTTAARGWSGPRLALKRDPKKKTSGKLEGEGFGGRPLRIKRAR